MRDKSRYNRYFTYIRPLTRLPIIRTYGSTIFTLLMMVIFIVFAIKPTVETILVLQKRLEEEEQLLQKVTKKADTLTQGRDNYQKLDQGVKDKIQSAIPDVVDLRSIIEILEQSAKLNEASISALQFQPLVLAERPKDTIGALSEVIFTFNVEGSFQKMMALLQDLKSSDRLISIDRVTVNKIEEESSLIMSISGKAYYLK